MRKIDTIESAEAFLLKHGENVVDRVGAEIDRIERNLRVRSSSSSSLHSSPYSLSSSFLGKTSLLTTRRS